MQMTPGLGQSMASGGIPTISVPNINMPVPNINMPLPNINMPLPNIPLPNLNPGTPIPMPMPLNVNGLGGLPAINGINGLPAINGLPSINGLAGNGITSITPLSTGMGATTNALPLPVPTMPGMTPGVPAPSITGKFDIPWGWNG
jgi:hypothetical protein